jgi:hypothetical protein
VLGVPPIRIDVLTSIEGIDSFAGAFRRRVNGRYGSTPTSFLSLEDLLASKLAAGRPQDLADADVLERTRARRTKRAPSKR